MGVIETSNRYATGAQSLMTTAGFASGWVLMDPLFQPPDAYVLAFFACASVAAGIVLERGLEYCAGASYEEFLEGTGRGARNGNQVDTIKNKAAYRRMKTLDIPGALHWRLQLPLAVNYFQGGGVGMVGAYLLEHLLQ